MEVGAHRLDGRHVERIWGRSDLPAAFAPPVPGAEPVGEIWFEDDSDADSDLLVKYLFTSERLSVQVHPDDAAARARGHPRGKDEAWYIVDAEPGAVIGLGLTREVSEGELRAAALDGSIEALLDWRPAKAGDVFYSAAGTVHAIGAGLSLVEIQQNLDLTYRLYDYGRGRALHLEEALAVADRRPWTPSAPPREIGPGRTLLAAGGAFTLERRQGGTLAGDALVIPLATAGTIDGRPLEAGSVWRVEGGAGIEGADALVASARGSS
jgi:mannose-6-phosphate isomerase